MFRRGISLLLVLTLAIGISVGCTTPAPEEPKEPEVPDEEVLKIGMVTDVGGVHDKAFNQSAWEGLQRARDELGIQVGYQESKQEADYADNLERLVEQENDLVWGVGYIMARQVKEAALNYPDIKFGIVDNTYDEIPKNLQPVVFKDQESSFLVGYIAGNMTKTNKVGFIGGTKSDVIDRFQYGYMKGIKYANPDCEILIQYAGAFDKPAIGRSIAESMYGDGADIIFHASGDTGNGMIEVAKEKNKYAIGVDRDQNQDAPEHVITSAIKKVDNAMFNVAKDLKEGKWNGGETIVYGLEEGGVDIAPTSNKHVPKEILDEVEKLKQKIMNGEIKVPQNEAEYKEMK